MQRRLKKRHDPWRTNSVLNCYEDITYQWGSSMKLLTFLFFCMTALVHVSCSGEMPVGNKVVAKINDYEISVDDFQTQLAEEQEFEKDFKLTEATKRQFLDDLIRKELLIQEAKRMDLDRERDFMKTIERYWESTLVRNLIARKSSEIDKKILVSEEEIQDGFKSLKSQNDDLPALESVHAILENEIRETKKSAALQVWMDELYRKANVTIDTDLLMKN